MINILSSIQSLSSKKQSNGEKSSTLAKLEQVYQDSLKRLRQKNQQKETIDQLQNFYKQAQKIFALQSTKGDSEPSTAYNSRAMSFTDQSTNCQQTDSAIKQSSSEYMFLKNAWDSRYNPKHGYDVQDHIDRINKVVAMVRLRTNYMTKKEAYLYEREELDSQYIYQNPTFMKVKEELERMTMKNEELMQKCVSQGEHILRLESEKSSLLENLTGLKKKYQQTEKNLISVSKKNICLEQDSLALKGQNSKSKQNTLRQNSDSNGFEGMELKRSTSFCKYVQAPKATQKSTQPSQSTATNPPPLPLQNVFIDISLNLSSRREGKQQKSVNFHMTSDTQNECNHNENHRTQNFNFQNYNNLQKLALCRSERLIIDDQPMKLRYIKNNDGNNARRTLLSAARSVDLIQKTSLNKPKFERTKTNYQNLLKSVNKDGAISPDINIDTSILKKHNVLNGEPSMLRTFRSSGRDFLPKREELKLGSPKH